MKIVQIPKPPEPVVTFADLKEGERFYFTDLDESCATLWQKIRKLGTREFFALSVNENESEREFAPVREHEKVRRAREEKAPPVKAPPVKASRYFCDLDAGQAFFFEGGDVAFLKVNDANKSHMLRLEDGCLFSPVGSVAVVPVHSEFHHTTL